MSQSLPNTLSTAPVLSPGATIFDQEEVHTRTIQLPEDLLLDIELDLLAWESLNNAKYSGTTDKDTKTSELTPELFREISAELALLDVEDELEEGVRALRPELSGHVAQEFQGEILRREKAFFTKVFMAAIEMAEIQPEPVTLLFDVDWTLTHYEDLVARPAFALVIRELDNILGDRLEVGLLTTKGAESIESEPYHPTYTKGVSHKLNTNFLISSGDLERDNKLSAFDSLLEGKDTLAQIEAAQDVLDPNIVESIRSATGNTAELYDVKLGILHELTVLYPDRAFILIDDLPFTDSIRRDSSKVKGVRVREEVLDKRLQPYSSAAQETQNT
jgi:hypothetical protein